MVRIYFKIAWRSIIKGKAYSALNILGLATGVITIVTISFQAIKAAIVNPVKGLRTE